MESSLSRSADADNQQDCRNCLLDGRVWAQFSSWISLSASGCLLGNLLPEGGFPSGKERILAGVPAEKMRRSRVRSMMFA